MGHKRPCEVAMKQIRVLKWREVTKLRKRHNAL